MVADDGNGRFEWLKTDMNYIKKRVDQIANNQSAPAATVRNQGHALRFIGTIIVGIVLAVIAHVLRG